MKTGSIYMLYRKISGISSDYKLIIYLRKYSIFFYNNDFKSLWNN